MTGCTTKRMSTITAAAVLLLLRPAAFAGQDCQKVTATFVDVFNGGCCTYGTVTQGGFLNGTTVTTYNSGAFPTPDPTIVSYSGNLTITTVQGELKIVNMYLYNLATGQGTTFGRIDSGASTGRFAGATGTVFLNLTKTTGTSVPFTYSLDLSGEICLAQ